jgi:hypothetical protein
MNRRFPFRSALRLLTVFAFLAMAGCDKPPAAPSATASLDNADSTPSEDTELTETPAPASAEANTDEDEASVDRSGQMLRHAVFFSFKDESSNEDIQSVIDAFAALPGKIDAIADFEWGTNNSPEGKDDGFTHCFLLSFKSLEDRDQYIPHPAHKGDFADVLRPHMKDVFVVDYWGTPGGSDVKEPLRHAVFFKFADDAAKADVEKVEQAFAALPSQVDAIKAFEWGTNNSPENKNDGFTHCFLVTFGSDKDREVYLPHPDHQAFVEVLLPVLDKVRVLDWTAQ